MIGPLPANRWRPTRHSVRVGRPHAFEIKLLGIKWNSLLACIHCEPDGMRAKASVMWIRTNKPDFLDNLITALIVGALCTFTLGLVPHFYFGVGVGTVYAGFVLLCMVVGYWSPASRALGRVANNPDRSSGA